MKHPFQSESASDRVFFGMWLAGIIGCFIFGTMVAEVVDGLPAVVSTDGGWLVSMLSFSVYWTVVYSTDRGWI